MLVWRRKKYKN